MSAVVARRRPARRVWPARLALLGPGVAWWIALFALPVGLVLAYSFFRRGPYAGVIYEPTLRNYARAFDPLYLRILLASLRIAAIATVIALVVGFPAAYAIATAATRWRLPLAAAGDPAVLDELPDPDLRLDDPAQPEGPDQPRPRTARADRRAVGDPLQRLRGRPRARVRLPPADGAADLRGARAPRVHPRGGGGRSVRHALADAAEGDDPAHGAGHRRGLHLRVRSEPRELHRSGPARRRRRP